VCHMVTVWGIICQYGMEAKEVIRCLLLILVCLMSVVCFVEISIRTLTTSVMFDILRIVLLSCYILAHLYKFSCATSVIHFDEIVLAFFGTICLIYIT
jgi:hypothetical protein